MLHYLGWVGETNAIFFLCFGRFILDFLEHPTYLGPGPLLVLQWCSKHRGYTKKQQEKSNNEVGQILKSNFFEGRSSKKMVFKIFPTSFFDFSCGLFVYPLCFEHHCKTKSGPGPKYVWCYRKSKIQRPKHKKKSR